MLNKILRASAGLCRVLAIVSLSTLTGCIISKQVGGGGDGGGGSDSGGSGGSDAGTGGVSGGGSGGSDAGSGGAGGSGGAATCGGLLGQVCEGGFYCDYADGDFCGAADAQGVCTLKPDACTEDCPGVCGCDGQFYCNACIAAQAGVDVSPNSSCTPPGDICGGFAGFTCSDDQYCDYPDASFCGAADQTGTCQLRPEVCQKDCPGVCGCDGQTYCNACLAAMAGIDVAADGSCAMPGEVCGGLANLQCPSDKYCDYPAAAICGDDDQTGTCQIRPDICPQDCPGVCGCDGQTYCNDCIAASSGVDVASDGPCNN